MKRIILILLAVLVLITACSNQIKLNSPPQKKTLKEKTQELPTFFQNLPQNRELTQEEINSGNFRELTLRISGMSCPFCAQGISNALLTLKGIIKADITLENKGGTVIYDSTKITKEDIVNSAVFEGVYKAKIISEKVIK